VWRTEQAGSEFNSNRSGMTGLLGARQKQVPFGFAQGRLSTPLKSASLGEKIRRVSVAPEGFVGPTRAFPRASPGLPWAILDGPFRERRTATVAGIRGNALLLPVTRMFNYLAHLRNTALQALAHDLFNTAKAVAYSGMLLLFPALLVVTTLLAQLPEGGTLVGAVRNGFGQVLPADSMELLQSYVLSSGFHSNRVIVSAGTLSVFAGLGMMLSLMEGFRRAYHLPLDDWSFWGRRLRALLLVPIALVPLSLATLVVVFGHQIELWMIAKANHELRHVVLIFWRLIRWTVALATSVAVLTALYHFGTRRKEHWLWVAPGAISGTLLWFPSTLAFGWYVTRVADYSMFYGSFGAGIATLIWLYITAVSVLLGAELNGSLFRERQERISASG
jgi:membrane protein